MTQLTIDIGNTLVKIGLFKSNDLIKTYTYKELNQRDLELIIKGNSVEKIIVSTVKNEQVVFKSKVATFFSFNHQTKLPIRIDYKTPSTLGLDRIAGVVGASRFAPDTNLMVIDIGTCITYDLLIDNVFVGGAISPGVNMRYKALNTFTNKLPLLHPEKKQPNMIGNCTNSSIHSGVLNGVKLEIEAMIAAYNKEFKDLTIFITGGDVNMFDLAIKNRIFANEFLVLYGLNEILNHND